MTIAKSLRESPFPLRVVLGGGIVLIAIAQGALFILSPVEAWSYPIALTTSVGGVLATCFSVLLARGITRYPGVEANAYLVPSFFIGYGILFTAFLLSRVGYSRSLLIADFALTLAWSMSVAAATNRRVLKVGIVPVGVYRNLLTVPFVQCVLLDNPGSDVDLPIDAVAADLQQDLGTSWERYLADCALRGVPVYHTKHLMESLTGKVELQHLSENSFGMLAPVSIFMTIKHAVDWVSALLFAVVFLPMFLILAFIIRLESPGSPIFRQQRIGYRGRPFTVYKFRTMTSSRDESNSPLEAAKTLEFDKRITRLGYVLRRARIDELLQVINILKGEMSWIGPRPEAKILSEWYEAEIPFYPYRHIVRPGITGWAQVNQGHVAEVSDVQNKLYYDFFYIKHYSLWIDLLIMARTAIIVFTGSGAK